MFFNIEANNFLYVFNLQNTKSVVLRMTTACGSSGDFLDSRCDDTFLFSIRLADVYGPVLLLVLYSLWEL